MAQDPIPAPPLDGVPPSPPGAQAGGGPNPSMSQLTPSGQVSGTLQVIQLSLQAAAQAAKLIDMLGQINPAFAPTAQMLIEQLKGGLRSSLQQGGAPSESQGQGLIGMGAASPQGMPPGQPGMGGVQQPLPPMQSGFQ